MSARKLQIVVDPLIRDCLKEIKGITKTDKIRWALSVYAAVLALQKEGLDAYDSQGILQRVMQDAGDRYRNNSRKK